MQNRVLPRAGMWRAGLGEAVAVKLALGRHVSLVGGIQCRRKARHKARQQQENQGIKA
jgi:hypothetical protein